MIVTIIIGNDGTEAVGEQVKEVRISEVVCDVYDILDVVQDALGEAGVAMPEGTIVGLEDEDVY